MIKLACIIVFCCLDKLCASVCLMLGCYVLGRAAQLLRLIPRDLFLADGSFFLSLCQSVSDVGVCMKCLEIQMFSGLLSFSPLLNYQCFGQSHLLFT